MHSELPSALESHSCTGKDAVRTIIGGGVLGSVRGIGGGGFMVNMWKIDEVSGRWQ